MILPLAGAGGLVLLIIMLQLYFTWKDYRYNKKMAEMMEEERNDG